jgi:uncharacterized protein with PIN domain
MNSFLVRLRFHGGLTFFLKGSGYETVERTLKEKTSIKDVIESCGIPHPEVDVILINREPVDFARTIDREMNVDVYPVEASPLQFRAQRLQQRGLTRFVADGHLGKLTRDLRLLGFDVLYDRDPSDRQLLELITLDQPSQSYGSAGQPSVAAATYGSEGHRALLTRDRRLLMHSIVEHGYYLRSQEPLEQTIEILRRFDLVDLIRPFTRCLRCNALLQPIDKNTVIDRLEPLTKIYYHDFRRCTGCGQLYWPGSHFGKLQTRIREIRGRFEE